MAPHDRDFSSPTCAAPAGWYGPDWDAEGPKTGWYFFYGTLIDPTILAGVIGDSQEPLKPFHARIEGYKTMLSGTLPALVRGQAGAVVGGTAFKIETATQARRLQGYMTDSFKIESCWVRFVGDDDQDTLVEGQTFVWNKPLAELEGKS